MSIRVPNFKDPELTKFLTQWQRELDSTKKDSLSSITGNHSILLVSPDKSVWEVKVSDLGALTTTKVAG